MIRRRYFQFSMRGFLVAVTVFAVWLGWNVEQAKRQREGVVELRAAGAQVFYDYQLRSASFAYEGRTVTLPVRMPDASPPCSPLIRRWLGDDLLYEACDVRAFINPDARKSACRCLPRLPYLRRLEITGVDDEDAIDIAQCAKLATLSASNGPLSNSGLMLFAKLKLRFIAIDCHVTEEGIRAFRSLNPNCDIWLNGKWVP